MFKLLDGDIWDLPGLTVVSLYYSYILYKSKTWEVAAASGDIDANGCEELDVKFIMLDGDATLDAIEDDIVSNLGVINTQVTTIKLEKDLFNTAMNLGDWNLAFSETWGPPYDPHR